MRLNSIIRELLFLAFILYFLQGWIYPEGSLVSKTCVGFLIVVSGVYLCITLLLNDRKSLFYKAWTFLVILNILGYVFTGDLSSQWHKDMFKTLLGCMLPFYPFYYFAKKDNIKSIQLIRFSLILLPVYIIQYYLNRSSIMLEFDVDETKTVINTSYLFVGLIPYVFLIRKNRLFSIAMMLFIMFFVIMGAKRGAIISGAVGLLIYYFYLMKTVEKRNRIFNYLLIVFVVLALSVTAYQIFIKNEFTLIRMLSLREGDSSGRDLIYRTILNNWYNSNFGNLIYGHGFAASIDITGKFAHSDWMELLSNFGLIGIISYLILFCSAASFCLKNEWSFDKRIIMATITIIWFIISFFSFWYSAMSWAPQTMLFGYLIGSNKESLD